MGQDFGFLVIKETTLILYIMHDMVNLVLVLVIVAKISLSGHIWPAILS